MLQYLRSTNSDSVISPQRKIYSLVRGCAAERPSDEEVSPDAGLDEDLIERWPARGAAYCGDDEWTYLIARREHRHLILTILPRRFYSASIKDHIM